MVDKLLKAFDGLKSLQFANFLEDKNLSKKDKMHICVLAADVMISVKPSNLQNLPVLIDNMINLCDDNDSDVRMVADECLNKVIMSLPESDMPKVQNELHKIIRKNGAARCLRAALSKFGQLSKYIRPNKGLIHVQMLVPSLIEISKRKEESVHETLASSFDNVFKVLGVFVQDTILKSLIKAYLHNLSSDSPVIRRCSSACIVKLVQYCRKPHVFSSYVLNSLLDCVVPVCERNTTDLILGVLGCLRLLLPTLASVTYDEGISGSFGLRKKQYDFYFSVDKLIQTYELCLYYSKSSDHNVVTAALETLNQILQNPPQQLESLFLCSAGFSRSYIHSSEENKQWSRSGSEISITLPPVDESFLLDDSEISLNFSNKSGPSKIPSILKDKFRFSEDECGKMADNTFREKVLGKIFGSQTNLENDSDTESSIVSEMNTPPLLLLPGEEEEEETEDVPDFVECSRTDSQENLFSPTESVSFQHCSASLAGDLGSFTDSEVPLIYCVRHLAGCFLLDPGSETAKSDRNVRVSVKSLALSCISAAVKLYPAAMKINFFKTPANVSTAESSQEISDILLLSDHSDPQIRGSVSVLIGSFIYSSLLDCKGFHSAWLDETASKLHLDNLVGIILKGLKDESSICIRQTLLAVKTFINLALLTLHNKRFLPILEYLPVLTDNSYWLVKVALAEVLSDLPYHVVQDLLESDAYQEEVLHSVLLPFLGEKDGRVRSAAAEAIVRIAPNLYSDKIPFFNFTKPFTEDINKWLKPNNYFGHDISPCSPFSLAWKNQCHEYNHSLECSLSKIVSKLTTLLMVAENKYFLFGYVEALKLLTEKYPTTVYPNAWNCSKSKSKDSGSGGDFLTSDLIAFVYSLLVTSPAILDLTAMSHATVLLGHLFAGHSLANLKSNYHATIPMKDGEPVCSLWNVFKSDRLSRLAEELFTHLLRVLNLYSCLIEEVPLNSINESSMMNNAFVPLLSPVKKQDKKIAEKSDERRTKNFYYVYHSTQYMKLQQLLKNAHTSFKVSLDKPVGEKFLDLLESNLFTLCILLEVSTARETGPHAEEILSYLKAVVGLRTTATISCVHQLLKSLFGTNLAYNWEEHTLTTLSYQGINLFDRIFQLPSEFLSEKIHRRVNVNSLECENLNGLRRRPPDKKIFMKYADKNWLATYIRLFEPMVVKALQSYTTSGNVKLQAGVLQLLNQLILLRINYCLLDDKQIFVGFILKQFELVECGQIPGIEILLPHIFKFLVLLSYEKQHSKPIMSVPKILQLCDGLMASDQPVQTHCIPALIPVVEDIFLLRNPVEDRELETQREVLLSMLLRLAEFPRVMDVLAMILTESKASEEKEKWKRWSRQIVDTMLNLAGQNRLRIESFEGQNSFINVMSAVSPSVLRPIDSLLKVLFVEPGDTNCCLSLNRWLSKVTVILETVLFVKEDALLNRIEETSVNVSLNNFAIGGKKTCASDPFNVDSFFQVYESSETMARFLLKVVLVVADKIVQSFSASFTLRKKLSVFFVCVHHIVKSGTFHRIANSLRSLLIEERQYSAVVCFLFKKMSLLCPYLTCQFSYLLTLLNYCDRSYWNDILSKPVTLSGKLIQSCGVLSLADYLCDNLSDAETLRNLVSNNFEEILILSREIPVRELLLAMRRRKADWAFLIDTIATKKFNHFKSSFLEKVLRLLETSDGSHSVKLLVLLIRSEYLGSPRLALSLLAGSIAGRQVEFLLTLPKEKVLDEMNDKFFRDLLSFFEDKHRTKRHFNLWNLLNRLGQKVFESVGKDLNQVRFAQVDDSIRIPLQEKWYFSQVKQWCSQNQCSGPEMACLLANLSYDRIMDILSCPSFNLKILKDCLTYSETLRGRKNEFSEAEGDRPESFDSDENSGELYRASKCRLLQIIRAIKQELVKGRQKFDAIANTVEVLDEVFKEGKSREMMWNVAPCVANLLEVTYRRNSDVDDDFAQDLVEIVFLFIEVIGFDSGAERDDIYTNNIENGFKCCCAILESQKVKALICKASNRERLKYCINRVYRTVLRLIPFGMHKRFNADEHDLNGDFLFQLDFLLMLSTTKFFKTLLPDYLADSFRDLIVNTCRIPELSSLVLKVPETCDMQEVERLNSFISRFSVIGWGNKQQFEEIWVALLAVLGFNTQGDIPDEETGFIVQASTVAVEGITTLLKNTMLDPRRKKLIHHGRDYLTMKNIYKNLPLVEAIYKSNQVGGRSYHFLDNLEISWKGDGYVSGLLSVEYLWTAVKQITGQVKLFDKHGHDLSRMGLDVPSCIYLLTELYSQWINQICPEVKIITSSLKSSIVISDLFTDITQFQWLLNFCLKIDESVAGEDAALLPLIILGASKAAAIVLPDLETCEKIKKLMLRSGSLPCRTATVQGLLYLLQSYVVSHAANHTSLPPPESTFQAHEPNFVVYIVDSFVPVALEIIQQFIYETNKMEEECERCHWSLIFYLLQNYPSSLGSFKEELINVIFATLRSKDCPEPLMSLLVRGIERLILTTVIDDAFKDRALKLSLDVISRCSFDACAHGLQLLMVLSFLDKRAKDIRQLVTGQDDPEKVMKDMEKINVLFEKLKKSFPKEAEVVGDVLSYILMDFTTSDVLTKVIQEFLSSQQSHQKILAGILFKVFERAELSLLEDWVVFSLPSFIQGMPISMSIWILNCFFVSASSESWLRSFFPLVQSRIRMTETEDKKLLCLSGALFYKQLKHESQKTSFIKALEKVSQTDPIFVDLLSALAV